MAARPGSTFEMHRYVVGPSMALLLLAAAVIVAPAPAQGFPPSAPMVGLFLNEVAGKVALSTEPSASPTKSVAVTQAGCVATPGASNGCTGYPFAQIAAPIDFRAAGDAALNIWLSSTQTQVVSGGIGFTLTVARATPVNLYAFTLSSGSAGGPRPGAGAKAERPFSRSGRRPPSSR